MEGDSWSIYQIMKLQLGAGHSVIGSDKVCVVNLNN